MTTPTHVEISRLETHIADLARRVLADMRRAMRAARNHDPTTAREILHRGEAVCRQAMQMQDACLTVVAEQRPADEDLRFLTTLVKIGHVLRQVEHLNIQIANCAERLGQTSSRTEAFDFDFLPEEIHFLLERTLHALTSADAAAAHDLLRDHQRLRAELDAAERTLLSRFHHQPSQTAHWTAYLDIARHLEHAADHAAHLAQQVVRGAENPLPYRPLGISP